MAIAGKMKMKNLKQLILFRSDTIRSNKRRSKLMYSRAKEKVFERARERRKKKLSVGGGGSEGPHFSSTGICVWEAITCQCSVVVGAQELFAALNWTIMVWYIDGLHSMLLPAEKVAIFETVAYLTTAWYCRSYCSLFAGINSSNVLQYTRCKRIINPFTVFISCF